MSVKHVCPNCGSTLTLDAPMPSLRCPKCKTTMQPETAVSDAAAPTATATTVRPMRVARTVNTIGAQATTAASPAETERLLEEARFRAQQERDRLLVEANKQIQQAQAEAETALKQLREQKLAEATAEANAILEAANQNAAQIKQEAEDTIQKQLAEAESTVQARLEEAEATAQKRLAEAEATIAQQMEKQSAENQQTEPSVASETPQVVAAQPVESFEEQKAKIDQLARQNQIRFWRLNAYIAILILTLICAIKSNGNTLVAVLSSLSAIIAIGLAAYAIYTLRSCIALLKAEKNGTTQPNPTPTPKPSIPRKTPSFKMKKEKPVVADTPSANTEQVAEGAASQDDAAQAEVAGNATMTAETDAAQSDAAQTAPRKTLLPLAKKKPAKPLFIKKKSSE